MPGNGTASAGGVRPSRTGRSPPLRSRGDPSGDPASDRRIDRATLEAEVTRVVGFAEDAGIPIRVLGSIGGRSCPATRPSCPRSSARTPTSIRRVPARREGTHRAARPTWLSRDREVYAASEGPGPSSTTRPGRPSRCLLRQARVLPRDPAGRSPRGSRADNPARRTAPVQSSRSSRSTRRTSSTSSCCCSNIRSASGRRHDRRGASPAVRRGLGPVADTDPEPRKGRALALTQLTSMLPASARWRRVARSRPGSTGNRNRWPGGCGPGSAIGASGGRTSTKSARVSGRFPRPYRKPRRSWR